MPLYEYYCPNCNHQVELIQKTTDVFNETCKNCGKTKMKKKLSLTSFQLKGGFGIRMALCQSQKKRMWPKKTNAATNQILLKNYAYQFLPGLYLHE